MENIVIAIIVLAIVAGIIFYLYRAKKSGQKCIGCPYAKQCSGKNSHNNSCGCGCSGCPGTDKLNKQDDTTN